MLYFICYNCNNNIFVLIKLMLLFAATNTLCLIVILLIVSEQSDCPLSWFLLLSCCTQSNAA